MGTVVNPSMTPSIPIQLSFLGDFQIWYKGQIVYQIHQPRLRSLLAYLVLHRDMPKTREELGHLFWIDSSEQQARTNLRNLLFQLRQKWPDIEHLLKINRHTIQWRCDVRFVVDVSEFEDVLKQAEAAAGNPDRLITLLKQAIALYKGDLLPGLYDDWIFPEQEHLRRSYQQALEQLIALLEGSRDYAAAIKYAQLLLSNAPLSEEHYRLLMRLYALNDDRASVKRVYLDCVATLWHELEVEPAPTTQAYFEQLLRDKQPSGISNQSPTLSAERTILAPFVGRKAEWQQLQAAWRDSIKGRLQAVLVTGESGLGKTRLALEMVTWAQRQGVTAAMVTCFASEAGCAFAPLGRLLRQAPFQQILDSAEHQWHGELLGLIPGYHEEQSDRAPSTDALTEWQRARIFETLAHLFLQARQPILFVLDDLQWCDAETLDWLRYLLRYIDEARQKSTHSYDNHPGILIVGTANSEELSDESPLTAWRFALRQRQQITEMELQSLNRCETAELISSELGSSDSDQLVDDFYHQSEGVPSYIVELLKAHTHAQTTVQDLFDAPLIDEVPAPIQLMLEARLGRLSSAARDLLALAALAGDQFTLDLLVNISHLDEELLIDLLDQALQRHIVVEMSASVYAFSHHLFRTVAEERLSQTRRQVLGRRVREALQDQQPPSETKPSAECYTGRAEVIGQPNPSP